MKPAILIRTSIFLAGALSAAAGCAGESGIEEGILEVAPGEEEGEIKGDGVTGLWLRDHFSFQGQNGRTTKAFSSNEEFFEVFGEDAPDEINFDKEWALYYAPGARSSGGYAANITRAQLSASQRTVTFWTEEVSPGPECVVTQATTNPGVIATIRRPGPITRRFSTRSQSFTQLCSRTCGDELDAQLAYGSRGAFYLSEADEPYQPVSFDGAGVEELTSDRVLEMLGKSAETHVEEYDWATWIDEETTPYDDDDYIVELAKDMAELQQTAELQLTDIKVFDVGGTPTGDGVRPLYILGRTECGNIAGYMTTIVAT